MSQTPQEWVGDCRVRGGQSQLLCPRASAETAPARSSQAANKQLDPEATAELVLGAWVSGAKGTERAFLGQRCTPQRAALGCSPFKVGLTLSRMLVHLGL